MIFFKTIEKFFNNEPACVLYIEKQPEFEYGLVSLQNYLESYLPGFGRVCLSGKVFLKFVVDKNGKVGNLEIVKGFGQPYDSMILKSLPEIPDFKPARINDQPVKTLLIFPLKYKI